jgi:hypothetical protein
MALHPTFPVPERILDFGPAGTGKTTNLLNIAKFAVMTHSDAKFHIIDSDFAMDRMITGYPTLPFGIWNDPQFPITADTVVNIYPVFLWREYEAALTYIQRIAKPNDWVAVDFISNAWAAVQDHFVAEVFHEDVGNYFLRARKELAKDAKSFNPLEGWMDWSVINPIYKGWVNKLLFRGRYHVYCTAKSDALSGDKKPTEDAQTRALFLKYGVKPVGQKDLAFQFHTVLLSGRADAPGRPTVRTISSVKDRERPECEGLPIVNFATDYLVNVAGWALV